MADPIAEQRSPSGRSPTGVSDGNTLVELVVVMIIIAIITAIAIPIFISQKRAGYRASMKSDLRNAATSLESFSVDNGGSYAALNGAVLAPVNTSSLEFNGTNGVSTTIVKATKTSYCIQATHSSLLLTETWVYVKANSSGVSAQQPIKLTGGCSSVVLA